MSLQHATYSFARFYFWTLSQHFTHFPGVCAYLHLFVPSTTIRCSVFLSRVAHASCEISHIIIQYLSFSDSQHYNISFCHSTPYRFNYFNAVLHHKLNLKCILRLIRLVTCAFSISNHNILNASLLREPYNSYNYSDIH